MENLAKEIKLYNQYSTSEKWVDWYAKVLPFKAQRTIKILRGYKDANAELLDVGCSTGLTLGFIAKVFSHTMGVDIDSQAIVIARKRFSKMGLKTKFFVYDGKTLPLKDKSVDIITSIEVFEHVDNPEVMLKEINRVLKSSGILHITTANKFWPVEPHFHLPFLSYLPIILADFYVRVMKRGRGYGGIKLPTYGQFYRMVARYFEIEDITLEVIKNYQKFGMEKERGRIVIYVARILRFLDKIKLSKLTNNLFLNVSLGWLFVCRPKK